MTHTGPDKSIVARMMLDWEKKKRRLNELEKCIGDVVMQMGETVVTGNVRAKYSEGRGKYDYEAAARLWAGCTPEIIAIFTKQPTPKTDWRGVCQHIKVLAEDLNEHLTLGTPSVKLTLEGE